MDASTVAVRRPLIRLYHTVVILIGFNPSTRIRTPRLILRLYRTCCTSYGTNYYLLTGWCTRGWVSIVSVNVTYFSSHHLRYTDSKRRRHIGYSRP